MHLTKRSRIAIALGLTAFAIVFAAACGTADSSNTNEVERTEANPSSTGASSDDSGTAPVERNDEDVSPEDLTPLPTPAPSDPFALTINVDLGPPLTPDEISTFYDFVIIGRVVEELPSQWTTPSGERPADPWTSVPDEFVVVTPYVIELEVPDSLSSLTGPVIMLDHSEDEPSVGPDATHVVVAAIGGKVGEDSVIYTGPAQRFYVGEPVLVAIGEGYGSDSDRSADELVATPAGPGWWTGVKYVFTAQDTIVDYGGERDAVHFVQELLLAAS